MVTNTPKYVVLLAVLALLAPAASAQEPETGQETRPATAQQEAYAEALATADRVVVAAAHLPDKVPEKDRISEPELVARVRERGVEADFVPTVERIVELLAGSLEAGDRVVILSNGGFGGIHDRLLESLAVGRRGGMAPPDDSSGTDERPVI